MSFDYSSCPLFFVSWNCVFVVENVLCMCCWCDVLCYCIVVVSCFVLFPWSCFFRQSNETHRTRTWNKEHEHWKLTKKKKKYQTINTRSKNPKLRTHPTTHNIQQKQTINEKNNIHSAWIISCFFLFSFVPRNCVDIVRCTCCWGAVLCSCYVCLLLCLCYCCSLSLILFLFYKIIWKTKNTNMEQRTRTIIINK